MALIALGHLLVRSTFFRHQVGILTQNDVEVRPAAIATLIHIVAREKLLWREHGGLCAVLELQTRLHNLGEGESVARATVGLIAEIRGEVEAVEITPVERLRQILIRNVVSNNFTLLVFLCLFESTSELWVLYVTEFVLVHLIEALKCRRDVVDTHFLEEAHGNRHIIAVKLEQRLFGLIIAMSTILGMGLLILADVGLPAEVRSIDSLDKQVHFVRRLMLQVQIAALFGPLALDVMILFMAGAVLNQRLSDAVLVSVAWKRVRLLLRRRLAASGVGHKIDGLH